MNDYYGNNYKNKKKKTKKKAKKISSKLLIIVQITVCSIILVTMLIIRFSSVNAYSVIKNWYFTNVNNSIIANEDIENVKHSVVELFPSGTNWFSNDNSKEKSSSNIEKSSKPSSQIQKQTNNQQVEH